jgi:cytochrome c peroxidase
MFWDGRVARLEEQALKPILNPIEHGLPSGIALLRTVERNPEYRQAFARAFPSTKPTITLARIGQALACYERTLVAADSPFDRYQFAGDRNALTPAAMRGIELFRGRAGCAACHRIDQKNATFMDGRFHRRGIGFQEVQPRLTQIADRVTGDSAARDRLIIGDPDVARLGRFVVTGDPKDIGSFKTPTLRNVALTGPYMHDGSVPTLERAVVLEAYYGAFDGAKPVVLSAREVQDVVEFLKSLTSPWAEPSPRSASASPEVPPQ